MSKSSIEGQGVPDITGQLQGLEINQFAPAPNVVGFRLLKLTNLLSQPFFKRIHKQHAISLNEWRAMVVLANKPGSAAQDIAEATGLIAMNVSRAVAELRKAGRISTSRDPKNHRRTLLWLTPEGEKLFSEIAPYSAMKAQEFYGSLGSEELEAFSRQLERLIRKAEEMLDSDAD
ncbi:MarR family winged helix-turn-helix transcriptional regulator [Paraburkholderia aromaticivorans]|uniref:MarR family winged helix-turn-helix transcriptional regulator n=1 Tax=Paraburkholderia aromaticivorans TaxID=2026199 RepID=UPI001455F715|nr:MarR family winged helix-turn-helix transcriptional regulator [Paraburkholderia aromaticivorans]